MTPTSTARRGLTVRTLVVGASGLLIAVAAAAWAAPDTASGHTGVSYTHIAHTGASPEDDGSDDDDGGDENKTENDDTNDEKEADGDKAANSEEPDELGDDCSSSELEPHDGFEEGPRCVDTSFGEVAEADQNPSLLITKAPDSVQSGEDFTLTVSTRNLVRDRFLGAADGGYYKESSFLDEGGIQRGHFHTACRLLDGTEEAPEPGPDPEFFVATQDNRGGAAPDSVEVPISGIAEAGVVQCAVWAGDGSHRLPMMQRANQIPAFDTVRIEIE